MDGITSQIAVSTAVVSSIIWLGNNEGKGIIQRRLIEELQDSVDSISLDVSIWLQSFKI